MSNTSSSGTTTNVKMLSVNPHSTSPKPDTQNVGNRAWLIVMKVISRI